MRILLADTLHFLGSECNGSFGLNRLSVYNLCSPRKRRCLIVLFILWLAILPGCGDPPCQDPPQEAFQSFVEQEWRMVETTNPSIQLSNTSFLIMAFRRNFTGEVYRVENNDRFDTPVLTFIYQVDPEVDTIIAEFEQTVGLTENGDPQSSPAGNSQYLYSLRRDFTLNESRTGFFYRFVPFNGVIDPDRLCTF